MRIFGLGVESSAVRHDHSPTSTLLLPMTVALGANEPGGVVHEEANIGPTKAIGAPLTVTDELPMQMFPSATGRTTGGGTAFSSFWTSPFAVRRA